MQNNIRNIGILAHVDAGKTSITENILFISGATKQLGQVDEGTSSTDFLEVEKKRGISVQSALTSFAWNDLTINLIDTPGHVDFLADLERNIRIIDAAILVISAVEGVQAHTETIWNSLRENNIPTLLFVNKIDRIGADTEQVIQEIKKELTENIILLQKPINEATNNCKIESCWNESFQDVTAIENLASTDIEILELFLEEKPIPFDFLNSKLKTAFQTKTICPILFGSAKLKIGITELLQALETYFPEPAETHNEKLSALVYKIEHDNKMGKIALVKVFSGHIKNREIVNIATTNKEEKVTQVQKILSNKYIDVGEVKAGDMAGLCGLSSVKAGDILGEKSHLIPKPVVIQNPLLTVQVVEENHKDYFALAEALQTLSEEDPSLNFEWIHDEKELNIKIMGWIQIEVLEHILESRFGIKTKIQEPTVIYKETPAKSGEGFARYWMPKPCWAIVKFKIEPAENGFGISYKSEVSVNKIHQKYQNEIERTIKSTLKQGIKGWEVTDLIITLIDGEDHEIHTKPGDFIIATPMAIMEGLTNTDTTLLEPLISFEIIASEDLLGAITSDITQMRGSFNSPELCNGKFVITGKLPVSTSLDFPIKLSSRSGGKAKIKTKFFGYQKCTDEQGIIQKFKGISPLDTAKYILKARKALQ